MYSHVLLQKLKRLNSAIHVHMYERSIKPGVCYKDSLGKHYPVCGTEHGWLEEFPKNDEWGNLICYGWRRVVLMVLQYKLTTKKLVRENFGGGFFEKRNLPSQFKLKTTSSEYIQAIKDVTDIDSRTVQTSDPIELKRQEMELENLNKSGSHALNKDQIAELSEQIHETYDDATKERLDKLDFQFRKHTKN